jgi:diguanylate cyclase (GGDEF)-like protein
MERGLAGFADLFATDQLPSPDGIALEVLKLSRRDDVTTGELARVIQADAALAARLIRAANASALAAGRPVISVGEAVLRLGVVAVRQLALGFALVDKYRSGACAAFDYEGFWVQSLRRALLQQSIAPRTRAGAADEMFACGLLADIGALALATVFPVAFGKLLQRHCGADAVERAAAERGAFGLDAGELGRAMLGHWGFPTPFLRALAARDAPDGAGFDEGSRPLVLARGFRLADLLLECDAAAAEEKPLLSSAIRLLGERLGLEATGVAAIEAEVARDWLEWAGLLKLPAPLASASVQPRDRVPGKSAPAETLRVLIVASDADRRALLRAIAQAGGHEATVAAAGAEALAAAVQAQPQALVTDLELPDLDGLALIRALRATEVGRELFAIVAARDEEADRLAAAIDAGADDYLCEPFDAAAMHAALRRAGRLLGQQRQLSRELRRLQSFASELALSNSLLQQQVVTDPLTGLPNRCFATEHIELQWSAAHRHHADLACLVIDVDHFKRVNDDFGHDRGDAVLRHVAGVLRRELRQHDVICRVGGEEFLAICPDTSASDAARLAERLRRAVASTAMPDAVDMPRLTVSIGVAGLTSDLRSTVELIGRADRAMYRAKALGRNQVCEYAQ